MKKNTLQMAVVLVLVFAVAERATAGSNTATLNVGATVTGRARITSVNDITFVGYDPSEPTTPNDAQGSVTVRATKGLSYTMYISADRSMTLVDTLTYELYSDAARTTVSGSTLATGEVYTSASNAVSTKTIYGRISPLQDVAAGSYTDTVTITLEF